MATLCESCKEEQSTFPYLKAEGIGITSTQKINALKRELAKLETDRKEFKAANDIDSLKVVDGRRIEIQDEIDKIEATMKPEESEIDVMIINRHLEKKMKELRAVDEELEKLEVDRQWLEVWKNDTENRPAALYNENFGLGYSDDYSVGNVAKTLNAKLRKERIEKAIEYLEKELSSGAI